MLLFMRLEERVAIFSLDDSDDTFAIESVFSFLRYPTLHFGMVFWFSALHCIGSGFLRALFALRGSNLRTWVCIARHEHMRRALQLGFQSVLFTLRIFACFGFTVP